MSSLIPSGFARSSVGLPALATVAALVCSVAGVQIGAAPQAGASTLAEEVATPPMGWNTWNSFGCDIDEELIKASADRIVTSGMKSAGYEYVVVDDCWMDPERDAQGNLRAHPDRFPNGMKALGDYIHAKGLKFGIYQVPTERTCGQRNNQFPGSTGSFEHEVQDAKSFAAWGVDYLKYDWCDYDFALSKASDPSKSQQENQQAELAYQKQRFTIMRDALAAATAGAAAATGSPERPIVYSINPNSFHKDKTGATFDWSGIANLWRTTEDIKPAWDTNKVNGYAMGVLNIARINGPLGGQAGPGHWNDPDMLEVGVRKGTESLTPAEERSHMSLWAQMAAPLMAGNKLTEMTPEVQQILTNPDVLAVDQDSLGKASRTVVSSGTQLVTIRELAGGDQSVTLTNLGAGEATVSTSVAELGIAGAPSYSVKDLWTGATTTTTGDLSATLPAHATAMYRITPSGAISANQALPGSGTYEIASATALAQVLDNPASSTANLTQMVTWQRKHSTNQRWALTANTDGTYALKNSASGKCLDVDNVSKTAGAKIIQYTCNNQSNQKFTLTPAGNHTYKLIAKHSNLAVTASGTIDKSALTQQAPAANQTWSLTRTS
ncbi:alpha-galactosidase [Streptomyces sp. NPDC099050]|uniref:alpha-galactosidase n=1 Tax=Streptomyces sp. NPDC099050 TaxID=3366100 RepID=UPI0038144CCF